MIQDELAAIATLFRVRIPVIKERKRTMPRGLLGKSFWDRQFKEVQDIVEDWGFDIDLKPGARDSVALGEVKTIMINSSAHPETKFYTLLHEVGHILIRRNWKKFAKHYPNYLDGPDAAVDGRREKRKSYRIGLIAEEIEAWKRGRAFADRHNLYIDPLKYDHDANGALMSYIDWIADISKTQVKAGRKAAKSRTRRAKK